MGHGSPNILGRAIACTIGLTIVVVANVAAVGLNVASAIRRRIEAERDDADIFVDVYSTLGDDAY